MNSPVANQEALFVIHQDADLEKIGVSSKNENSAIFLF